jgi:hypothetical protein
MGDNIINSFYDNTYDFQEDDIFEMKFNSLTRIQNKEFNPKTYEKEKPLLVKDQKGDDMEKFIPHKNFIRWRYAKKSKENTSNEDENESLNEENSNTDEKTLLDMFSLNQKNKRKIESNSKLVQYSDNSYLLFIGKNYFEVLLSDVNTCGLGVIDAENDSILVNKTIEKKMILKENEKCSNNDLDKQLIEESNKKSKVLLTHNYYNPIEYVKEDSSNKFAKKPAKKEKEKVKEKEEDFANKKRHRT